MSDPVGDIPVRIEPLDMVMLCHRNETLIQSAWRNGYYWPTICGGMGHCGACRCELIEGRQHAESMGAVEKRLLSTHLKMAEPDGMVRLACCMTVNGPMTVFKKGVRPK